MKLEVPNPVHCCMCVNLGRMSERAATIVNGYAVCIAHSTWIDQYDTLQDALIAHDNRQAQRKAT